MTLDKSEQGLVVFEFSQNMKNFEVTDEHMQLVISGPNPPYSVSWDSEWKDDRTLEVTYSVSPKLVGGN